MTDNMTGQMLGKLNDSYEDQLFRLAVGNLTAEAEGEELLRAFMTEAPEAPSPEAVKRFTARLGRQLRQYQAAARRDAGRPQKFIRKAVIVLLAAIALFAVAMLTVSAFRIRVLNLFLKMEPKYTSMQLTDSESSETQNGGLVLDLKDEYLPTDIPEGYEVTSVSNIDRSLIINFTNTSSESTFSYCEYKTGNDVSLDSENAELVKQVKVGGNAGTLVIKNSTTTLAWVADNHLFTIFGQISEDDAVKTASSVKYIK